MDEWYVQSGELIDEAKWKRVVASFALSPHIHDENLPEALIRLIEKSVLERCKGNDRIAIFFSGGLDSSLIASVCKKHGIRFTCYTVGFMDGNMQEPADVTQAVKVAQHLELTKDEFKVKVFNLAEAEGIIKRTAAMLKHIDHENDEMNAIVNLGVGAVVVAAYSISDKESLFFSGLGSEELFAGYDRHKNTPTNEECQRGLGIMYERDLLRDHAISSGLDFQFSTPFLDKEVIGYALRIPISMKIDEKDNKKILRIAAHDLLGEFASRPKKAAQYGSSFDKAITRLAAQNGFTTKKAYFESLCR